MVKRFNIRFRIGYIICKIIGHRHGIHFWDDVPYEGICTRCEKTWEL